MLIQNKAVIIVDAFSTGKYLAPVFKGFGYQCVHIQSDKNICPFFLKSFEKNNFIKNIVFEKDFNAIIKDLLDHDIKMVIPGCESGVELADKIADRLGLRSGNNVDSSAVRRDKYFMHERLRDSGVAAIDQLLSSDQNEIIKWVHEKTRFPIVIKPARSAGTDSVSFCYNDADVSEAFNKIINKKDLFGYLNQKVLAQKMVEGQEYIVNSVSYNGVHSIVDIWTSNKTKINGSPVYDYQELLAEDDDDFHVLSEYVMSVLNALEIKFGAGHSEVMLTQNGPVLIEIGARLAGGIDPSSTHEALGYSQVSILADAYLNPDVFFEFARNKRSALKKNVLITFLISHEEGIIKKDFEKKYFANIKDIHSIDFWLNVGNRLEKTSSLVSSPGLVYLISSSKTVLQDGHEKIREIENQIYRMLTT